MLRPKYSDDVQKQMDYFEKLQIDHFFEGFYHFDAMKSFLGDPTTSAEAAATYTALGLKTDGSADYSKTGKMTISGETVVIPGFEKDAKLRLILKGSVPNALVENADGVILNHYVQLKNLDRRTAEPISLTCSFTIGKPKAHKVRQWTKEYDPTNLKQGLVPEGQQVKPEDQFFFDAANAEYLYKATHTAESFETSCAAEMKLAALTEEQWE